jgi:hypothetical protein
MMAQGGLMMASVAAELRQALEATAGRADRSVQSLTGIPHNHPLHFLARRLAPLLRVQPLHPHRS